MTVVHTQKQVASGNYQGDHRVIWPFPVQDFGFTNYVRYPDLFTKDECKGLIEVHQGNLIHRRERIVKVEPEGVHTYNVSLLSTAYDWIYDRVAQAFLDVNRDHWRYGLSGMVEEMRLIHSVVGDRSDMHCDHTEIDLSKIGCSISLSSAKEGGEFMLAPWGALKQSVGEGIFFPAGMGHGARPVVKGERYQAIAWAAGPRFV